MKKYRVRGKEFMAHDSNCADSFKEDRKHGLIYSSYRVIDDDNNSTIMGVEDASVACGFCAYCG